MSTSKPPEIPKADSTADTKSGAMGTDPKNKMILTVFPKVATATEIAEALHKLARERSPKS